jgi:hypothetical protein
MKRLLLVLTFGTVGLMGYAALAPGAAIASGTFQWGGNGFPNATCTAGQVQTMLWIFNDNGSAVPTGLTINGVAQAGSWVQQGGGTYHFTTSGAQFPPVKGATTFVTFTGELGNSTVLTLSGCNEGGTTTTTVTPPSSTTPTKTTTTATTTTTTTTPVTTTTTTTPVTTTTTTPVTTTTVPGGGGGGGGTTTTTVPTTTPPSATSTTTAPPVGGPGPGGGGGNGGGGNQGTQPIGTAFTGFEVQPWMWIAVVGLLLLGSTMLMRGYALRHDDE